MNFHVNFLNTTFSRLPPLASVACTRSHPIPCYAAAAVCGLWRYISVICFCHCLTVFCIAVSVCTGLLWNDYHRKFQHSGVVHLSDRASCRTTSCGETIFRRRVTRMSVTLQPNFCRLNEISCSLSVTTRPTVDFTTLHSSPVKRTASGSVSL